MTFFKSNKLRKRKTTTITAKEILKKIEIINQDYEEEMSRLKKEQIDLISKLQIELERAKLEQIREKFKQG